MKTDLGALEPNPTKVVANLPYGVAATVVLKSIAELPGARLWVAMVQREVADRLAATPGGKSYGATSVLAQLSCEVRFLRKVPRTVFHPEPNVDSALVVLRRRAPAPPGAPGDRRAAARTALEELGHPADARAERLPAEDWPRLAEALGAERLAELRPRTA